VDPVPDPLLFLSGSAVNRTRASGSVAKNSKAYEIWCLTQNKFSDFKDKVRVYIFAYKKNEGMESDV
jgi:hypothetical protein